MNRTSLVRVAAAGAAVLSLTAAGLATSDGREVDRTVRTTLADAGSLEQGNEVRAAGVRVGEIRSIRLRDRHADVMLNVDPSVLPLHRDASLKVRPVNLLGENYIELNPGSDSEPFMDPAVIPMSRTEYAVTLQDVLNTFHKPTAAALAAVVTALGEGLADNGGEVAAALKALAPTMNRADDLGKLLSQQNEALDGLVTKLDPVARAVAVEDGGVLDRLVTSTQKTLAAVTADQQALEQTLIELPGTLQSAQRTLAEFGGVADQATPTLKAIRPLTKDLNQVTDELQHFADAADPALAGLQPVLQHADTLLDQAAPAVAQLRQAGPDLRRTAKSARPIADELLDEHLGDLMAFVRKWSLSTNGRDGISHYFRGVVYVTPETLKSLAKSLVPASASGGEKVPGPLGLPSAGVPKLPALPDPLNATGLTSEQEQSLVGQLLGGGL